MSRRCCVMRKPAFFSSCSNTRARVSVLVMGRS
jgi:hypothetical protein